MRHKHVDLQLNAFARWIPEFICLPAPSPVFKRLVNALSFDA